MTLAKGFVAERHQDGQTGGERLGIHTVRAVVEAEAGAVAAQMELATRTLREPLAALLAGSDAYLDAMTVPGRTRLLLVDGPAVLGSEAMQAIDEGSSALALREAKAAMRFLLVKVVEAK